MNKLMGDNMSKVPAGGEGGVGNKFEVLNNQLDNDGALNDALDDAITCEDQCKAIVEKILNTNKLQVNIKRLKQCLFNLLRRGGKPTEQVNVLNNNNALNNDKVYELLRNICESGDESTPPTRRVEKIWQFIVSLFPKKPHQELREKYVQRVKYLCEQQNIDMSDAVERMLDGYITTGKICVFRPVENELGSR